MTIEFIEEPSFVPRTRYKVRAFVDELMKTPNRWAIYSRTNGKDDRQKMTNCYSAVNRYRLRYPEVRWEPARDDQGWYVTAIYEQEA
jgi:tagatose-1,6-bisphosphate aldolase non-catalytic subunit AgaZ/GatZ